MWNWCEALSPSVGFATWVLQRDGLRVHPFDLHAEGDGRLLALGLNEPDWRSWIVTIAQAEAVFADYMARHDIRTLGRAERQDIARLDDQRVPVHLWPGDPKLRPVLDQLWAEYRPVGETWASSLTARPRHTRISPGQDRRLWAQLEPLRNQLSTLRVYLVPYPYAVALAIPPESCVVGLVDIPGDGREYVDAVVAAARALTAPAGLTQLGAPQGT